MMTTYQIYHINEYGYHAKMGQCAGTNMADACKRYVKRVATACAEQGHKMSDTDYRHYYGVEIKHRT